MQILDILLKLVPFTHKDDNGVFFTMNLSFGDWIVTIIEILLIGIFLFTAIRLWYSYKKDLKSANLLSNETKLLKEKGFTYYNDFKNNLKVDKKINHLWSEFDESLIPKENGQYENSLDASYFFNRSSLASHVGSKFYSAVPGILLGVGLLGTFFALYVALIELNLEGDGLKDSIRVFIGMVGVKFTASVWGIFLSVVFTFLEKVLESKLSHKIHGLQDNIDDVFRRQTAEQNLFKIANESEQQTRAMNSLAETLTQKISEQFNPILTTMNKNLEQMPLHISKAIGETLSGPLEQLKNSAANAAESQSDSLESIVNTFIDKLDSTSGDQAQGIQNMMAQTTEQLTFLLKSMKDITLTQSVMQKEREEKMQELFHRTMTSFEEQMKQVRDVFGTVSKEASSSMNEMYSNQQASLSQERTSMSEQMLEMKDVFITLSNETSTAMSTAYEKQHETLENERKEMANQMNEMKESFTSLSSQSTENFSDMFNQQQQTLIGERESISKHGQEISSQMQSLITSMAEQSGSRDEKLQEMMQMIQEQHSQLFSRNKEFASELENSMAQVMSNIVSKVTEVQSLINETASKLIAVPGMLNSFEDSSQNLKEFGETTKEATLALSGAVQELHNVQTSVSEQLNDVREHTQSLNDISSSTQVVATASEQSAKVLQETYKVLINENNENLEKLGESMSKWLGEYDSQVHSTMQGSLNEVQGALSNFANTLTQSMGSLEDAIESINTKVQG